MILTSKVRLFLPGSCGQTEDTCSFPIAISFVGSNQAGEYIYNRGCANGKRVQANLGAKNHAIVLPDADKKSALDAIAGAAFGAAGQRYTLSRFDLFFCS